MYDSLLLPWRAMKNFDIYHIPTLSLLTQSLYVCGISFAITYCFCLLPAVSKERICLGRGLQVIPDHRSPQDFLETHHDIQQQHQQFQQQHLLKIYCVYSVYISLVEDILEAYFSWSAGRTWQQCLCQSSQSSPSCSLVSADGRKLLLGD